MMHTKTPWETVFVNPNRDVIMGDGGKTFVVGVDHPHWDEECKNNLLTIVECVNACAEINPINPLGAGKHLAETVRAADEVIQIWDDLYSGAADDGEAAAWKTLKDAIAKMKGYV